MTGAMKSTQMDIMHCNESFQRAIAPLVKVKLDLINRSVPTYILFPNAITIETSVRYSQEIEAILAAIDRAAEEIRQIYLKRLVL